MGGREGRRGDGLVPFQFYNSVGNRILFWFVYVAAGGAPFGPSRAAALVFTVITGE